jgi:hypothetical protein
VRAWAHLGLHLAEKIRGGVDLELYRQGAPESHKLSAVAHLERALAHWDDLIEITKPLYRDMRLTHTIGSSKSLNPDGYFHWSLLRSEVSKDVEVAKRARND